MFERAKDDYSWSRPNRRYASMGIFMPSLYSERMGTIVVVTDELAKWSKPEIFPSGVEFFHRDELDAVQKKLREVKGTSIG